MVRALATGGLAAALAAAAAVPALGAGVSVQTDQRTGQPTTVVIRITGAAGETASAYARPDDGRRCETTAAAFRAATPGAEVLLAETALTGEPLTVSYSPTPPAAVTLRVCAYVEGGSGGATSRSRAEVVVTVQPVPAGTPAPAPSPPPDEQVGQRVAALLRDLQVVLRDRLAVLRWECPPASGALAGPVVVTVRGERGVGVPVLSRGPAARATLRGACERPQGAFSTARGVRLGLAGGGEGLVVRHPGAPGTYRIEVRQGGKVVYRLRYVVRKAPGGWTAARTRVLASARG